MIDLTARMCPKKKIGFRPAHKKELVRDSELHGNQVGRGEGLWRTLPISEPGADGHEDERHCSDGALSTRRQALREIFHVRPCSTAPLCQRWGGEHHAARQGGFGAQFGQ